MSKYTRKWLLKIEGAGAEEIWVGSLTCAQTEIYLEAQKEALANEDKDKRMELLVENAYSFVVNALNNVLPEGDANKWTRKRVEAELDKEQIDEIQNLAMDKSGLTRPNPPSPVTA